MNLVVGVVDGQFTGQLNTIKTFCQILNKYSYCDTKLIRQPHKVSIFSILLYYYVIIRSFWKNDINIVYLSISRTKRSFYVRDLIVLFLASILRKDLLIHIVGNDFKSFTSSSKLIKLIYRSIFLSRNSKLIVLSERMKIDVLASLKLTDVETTALVLPAFVNVPKNLNEIINNKESCDQGVRYIGFMSNLLPEKGFNEYLNAVKSIKNTIQGKDLNFWIAGARQANTEYSLLDELIDLEYIEYHEFIDGKLKANFLSKTEVFVLPTYYETEALPLSILEAALYGAFIITCDVGDITASLPSNCMSIVPSKDSSTLQREMLTFLADNDFDPSFASNFVRKNYGLDQYEKRLVSFLSNFRVLKIKKV